MSSEAVGWVFRHSPYRGAAFAVHLAIADSVNDQHEDRFWMKQARLAAKARVGRGAVVSALQAMTEDGLLELVEDRHAQGRPNEYRLLMPADSPEVYARTLSAETTRGARPADTPCAPSAQGGARPARKKNPSTNPTLNPSDTAREVVAELRLVSMDEAQSGPTFGDFWSAYPRKVGKPEAEKAWKVKVGSLSAAGEVMAGLERWAGYWRARGEAQFVPHPSTWLRREGWNDEPPPLTGKAKAGQAAPVVQDRSRPSGEVIL